MSCLSRHNSIKLVEPVRGERLMLAANDRIHKHYLLSKIVPYTADLFVFTYPVYLVGLYLWGVNKSRVYYKQAALTFFFSAGLAALINMVIQYFGDKSRPELAVENKEQLILSHIPTDPFPSDHAAVSAAMAMSTLLRGMRYRDKHVLRVSIFFWIASGLMSISRVAVAIHWPTDIIAGIGVGVVSALIVISKGVWHRLASKVFANLIALEQRIFKHVFQINQEP